MFSRRSKKPEIDKEQQQLFEHARARIMQKRRLFQHFVAFIVGSFFLIIANVVLGFGKDVLFFGVNWFVFAILFWGFLFILHFCRVWLFHSFMGAEWELKQMELLIAKQKKRIAELQLQVDSDYPIATPSMDEMRQLPVNEDKQPPL